MISAFRSMYFFIKDSLATDRTFLTFCIEVPDISATSFFALFCLNDKYIIPACLFDHPVIMSSTKAVDTSNSSLTSCHGVFMLNLCLPMLSSWRPEYINASPSEVTIFYEMKSIPPMPMETLASHVPESLLGV